MYNIIGRNTGFAGYIYGYAYNFWNTDDGLLGLFCHTCTGMDATQEKVQRTELLDGYDALRFCWIYAHCFKGHHTGLFFYCNR